MSAVQTKDLPQSITITIQGNDYIVEFPDVDKLIQIESNKILLSNNTYGALAVQNLKLSNVALAYIDAIATFSVLIPHLKEGLRLRSLTDLSLVQAQELTQAYTEQFAPWFWKWISEITDLKEELEEVKDNLELTKEEIKDGTEEETDKDFD